MQTNFRPTFDVSPCDPRDFLTESYDYFLPPELIAQRPQEKRDESRLLLTRLDNPGVYEDRIFHELVDILPQNSLLIFNQSKVFPCRLMAQRPTGGKVEIFILSLIPNEHGQFQALLKYSATKKCGDEFLLPDGLCAVLKKIGEDGDFWLEIPMSSSALEAYLQKQALLPLPPYIRDGVAQSSDWETYQTAYAKEVGSVAAPTAGLHFTPDLLERLKEKGHTAKAITLHVGLGTFRPVKVSHTNEHVMHEESYSFPEETLSAYLKAKKEGRPIIAVGTTSLRALESSFDFNKSEKEHKEEKEDGQNPRVLVRGGEWFKTRLFLRPGEKIYSVDGLLTNFHLPRSTLLMLVSSLVGREEMLRLYETAIKRRYRFFSYGDAMLILRKGLEIS